MVKNMIEMMDTLVDEENVRGASSISDPQFR